MPELYARSLEVAYVAAGSRTRLINRLYNPSAN